ncbi:MAG TPA: hypothetical protein VMU05_17450 [Dongiaceae bacterium]|nr:hypothetical protein [Dongiaceae bacterium]
MLLQRLITGAILLHGGFLQLGPNPHLGQILLQLLAPVLLMIGFGTPYIGLIVAGTQVRLAFSGLADPWTAIMLSGLGISLAMIGPGAWSIDARFFGRKHVEIVKK